MKIKNSIIKAMEYLEVKLFERFYIGAKDKTFEDGEFYYFSPIQLCCTNPNKNTDIVLGKLISGEYIIIKYPWKPRDSEMVWINTNYFYHPFSIFFDSTDSYHLLMYKVGKVYRTKEDALEHFEKDKKFWKDLKKEVEE